MADRSLPQGGADFKYGPPERDVTYASTMSEQKWHSVD